LVLVSCILHYAGILMEWIPLLRYSLDGLDGLLPNKKEMNEIIQEDITWITLLGGYNLRWSSVLSTSWSFEMASSFDSLRHCDNGCLGHGPLRDVPSVLSLASSGS
jgi:hypothetical protein